ncbi:TPA: hypothetical protein DEA21_00945 [Candidatus Uhrbacteria bacterium]|nr:hypothetical protein [Candidatus Uhrbacteria bacterium]HCU31577.1 hypothetical protein [Candidatus Uhrbacteria bacterium]
MKKIIVIRGPLGVGKTTVAKLLAKKLDAEYLSVDKIIDDHNLVVSEGILVENFLKANQIIIDLIDEQEKTFIIDGCFYYSEQIEYLKQRFGESLRIFSLVSDVETCFDRDAKREVFYGEASTRFVHEITSKVKAGVEIDNSGLTVEETVGRILGKIFTS